MEIEFDQAKSEKNRLERDLPFDLVATFEWDSAVVWPDSRHEYGETRYCAIGYIGVRLYHLVFYDALRVGQGYQPAHSQ